MLKLVVCVALLALCHPIHGEKTNREARVLILGAGGAGLQAARRFHDAGMDDFIILEGADRKGGRVHDTEFGGMTVELGAAWASPSGTETLKIIEKLDLERWISDYDSHTYFNAAGDTVTDAAYERYDVFEPAMEHVVEIRDRMNDDDDIPDMSLRSSLRLGGWEALDALDNVIEWFDFDFEYAERTDVSSTRQSETFDDTYFMKDPGGLKQIFDDIAGFLDGPEFINHTHLNKKVSSIDYSNDVSVVVECEDGTRYIGEYVLVTFSIGVLQRNHIQFTPSLPEWKRAVIDKSRMGSYTQVYITFPTKFWDDVEWIVHASDRKGYYPIFLNLQAMGLYPSGTPMLMAHITGDESRRVEAQPADQTKAEIEEVLRTLYGASSPGADGILVSDWSRNPLTEGAYSNWPVDISDDCFEKLESRVGRVFFAGEATSSEYLGYVEGALESGNREANKIKECMADFSECPIFEGQGLVCEKPSTGSAVSVRFNALMVSIATLVGLRLINFC
ncbi:polyamine oxidase 7-like [Asterias rubens]|uniref:polyamine oxidase 7-like n=1 Tax=Asterias rubens TaxID=7604 RepID=UPI001455AD8C|nr:polyamine oxidase 7-like [Asterias rubens]